MGPWQSFKKIVELDQWAVLVEGPRSLDLFRDLPVNMRRLFPFRVYFCGKNWFLIFASKK